jgi:hypothetical protein
VALAITLSLSAAAEQAKKPAQSQHRAGDPAAKPKEFKDALHPTPPSSCSPCAFYGGDFNPSDPNAAGLSDENTFYIPGSSTYGAIIVPTGDTVSVMGALVNVQASAAFDPLTATYDVRTGVTDGDGGTSIASGNAHASVVATGRSFLGLYEYTITVPIALTLTPGEYWINVTPTCTDALDGSCYLFRQFVSNTTEATNSVHASWQPPDSEYLNSPFFGFTFANWCDSSLGLNPTQCGQLSFGVIGDVL